MTAGAAVEALIEDAIELARIPAPTFDEGARTAWLERRLAGTTGRLRRDDVGNLLWEWGREQPHLLLTAHVDTVFGHEVAHEIRREGARLTGPGIGDNAIAVAMAVSVGEQLLAEGGLAAGAIAFTVGEEGRGNLRGAIAACRELSPRALIALEGHGLDRVFVDAVGSVRASLRVSGPGGHSWADSGRPSAVHALLELGAALTARSTAHAPINIGLVSGGRSVNTIADSGELVVEMRSTDEALLDALARELDTLRLAPPLSLAVELIGRRPAGRLARDAELLRVVRGVRAELGLPAVEDAASTDANAGLAAGIPSLALGAALGADMHTTTEHIDVDSLALGRRQLELVLRRLLAHSVAVAAAEA